MSTTSLSRPKSLTKKGELVTMKYSDWQRLEQYIRELRHALKVIARGEREIKSGQAIRASSIDEALKLYGKTAH